MNILMMTNTWTPHVGGVARSVAAFTEEYRRRDHRVLVVAPEFENMPKHELDVIRIPAIQNFNGSDFSVVLPVSGRLGDTIERFRPDVIHSHHPFLVGSMALRLAQVHEIPLVFTHHTMYERYTHYVPADSRALKRFVIRLSTSYANLCDRVFAPSESVANVIEGRGVIAPIDVIPTGVRLARFDGGSGSGFRAAAGIPRDAFVVGHVGRLAPEKNIAFLTRAVIAFLEREPRAHFVVAGRGPLEEEMRERFARAKLGSRFHALGILEDPLLPSAYRAMDVFAFASTSETQGMVLSEAMAAAVPVVAIDSPGVRELVVDEVNGRLLAAEDLGAFVDALGWIAALPKERVARLAQGARRTAREYGLDGCAERALAIYASLGAGDRRRDAERVDAWQTTVRRIEAEWNALKRMAEAAAAAFGGEDEGAPRAS